MTFDPNKVTWHDTSDITMIACNVDDGIENTQDQFNIFLKAEDDPDILDDEEINRALKKAADDSISIEVYVEQLNRWRNGNLTTVQENKVNRISQEIEKYQDLLDKYVDLLKKLSVKVSENKVNMGPEAPVPEELPEESKDSLI